MFHSNAATPIATTPAAALSLLAVRATAAPVKLATGGELEVSWAMGAALVVAAGGGCCVTTGGSVAAAGGGNAAAVKVLVEVLSAAGGGAPTPGGGMVMVPLTMGRRAAAAW